MEKDNACIEEKNFEDIKKDVFTQNNSDMDSAIETEKVVSLKKESTGVYDQMTNMFMRFFGKRMIICFIIITAILIVAIFRSAKYKGLVLDAENIQQSIYDIKNKEIFVSSKLVEYKNQDLIENEIKNKNLDLVIADEAPYLIEDENN